MTDIIFDWRDHWETTPKVSVGRLLLNCIKNFFLLVAMLAAALIATAVCTGIVVWVEVDFFMKGWL